MSDSKSQRPQLGFTLIEALVALLVLAIGLLGVAAMQLKAVQSAHVSYQRSIAVVAAQDAEERLWVEMMVHSMVCPFKDSSELAHVQNWGAAWRPYFNELQVDSSLGLAEEGCAFRVLLGWSDERFIDEEVSTLVFLAKLPGK
ncbi:type IV pilus assembly protein PilV [Halomonas campaniensis]|uniref:Type IV pilus assembly protein PilV n=1 Tax=Halomonas campaniensis TaxID=213554 RepID=A0A7W5PD24_9GAMM|nr:type IV pilus modification protein PilV [Halomonas campaniensis]MBB3332586.1 type IV pilus assembly protein PilV [Halomonas campaniensis]